MSFLDVGSLVGSLGGGIINAFTANKTNKRNIAMQRETNALNYKMFQEQNSFNREMFNAANEWNSPSNQRKLLEEAGYNPSSLFEGGSASPASALQSASPSPAVSPKEQMVDYGSIFNNAIQAYAAMKQSKVADAEARKADAEANGIQIDNLTKSEMNIAQLKALGKSTELTEKEIENLGYKNVVDATSMEADILAREETANNLLATAQRSQAEASIASIKARLEEEYGPKRAEQEYKNLQKQFDVLCEQVGTEKAQQYMYRKTGDSNWLNAKTNQAVGASQILANQAAAKKSYNEATEAEKRTYRLDLENAVYEAFGRGEAAQRFLNSMYSGEMLRKDANIAAMLNDMMADGKMVRSTLVLGELFKAISPFVSSSGMASAAHVLLK